jgi:S1-C subfamily serine protease
MTFTRRFVSLLCLGALLLEGCAHLATPAEKQVSYQRFESVNVLGVKLSDFLQRRTAVIVSGAMPHLVSARDREVNLRFDPVAADGFDIGSATAVDFPGYYLTAAHCVPRRPVFLLLPSGSGATIIPARVVWSAPKDSPFDIAIIQGNTGNTAYFTLEDPPSFAAGCDVVTAGSNGLAGGRLLESFKWTAPAAGQSPATAPTPAAIAYVHSAPLAEGDSGGPLTTSTGELIGVEVLARGILLGSTQGIALRPDAAWLANVIAEDHLEHPATQPSETP